VREVLQLMASQHKKAIAVLALLAALAAPAAAAWRLEALRPLTKSGEAVAPVLSPDGVRLAYIVGTRKPRTGDGAGKPDALSGRVWSLRPAENEAERLGRFGVTLPAGERPAAFAPGGAYAMVEGSPEAPNLWYVSADGARYRVGGGRAMAFDAKGAYLAYTVLEPEDGPATELWLYDTERRESKRLSRVVTREMPDAVDAPRWTPDNARILFRAGGDLYAYARFTGRIEPVTRSGDVAGFDLAANGAVWYYRQARDRDAAGLWLQRPDGKTSMRAFRADELPPGISGLSAGPEPDSVLFLADTAMGRGLVAADMRDGRWRWLAAADAFSVRPKGRDVALEVPSADGRRNIHLGLSLIHI